MKNQNQNNNVKILDPDATFQGNQNNQKDEIKQEIKQETSNQQSQPITIPPVPSRLWLYISIFIVALIIISVIASIILLKRNSIEKPTIKTEHNMINFLLSDGSTDILSEYHELCENQNFGTIIKSSCYNLIAIIENNKAYCEILNGTFKEECNNLVNTCDLNNQQHCISIIQTTLINYQSQLLQTNNIPNCNQITDETQKQNCIYSLAIKSKNTSLCRELTEPKKTTCLSRINTQSTSTEECNQQESEDKQICLHALALRTGDISTCEQMQDSPRKTSCINTINNL